MGNRSRCASRSRKRTKIALAMRAVWRNRKAKYQPVFQSIRADIDIVNITHDYCRIKHVSPDIQTMEHSERKVVGLCNTKQEYGSTSTHKLEITCRTCKQESLNMKTIFSKDLSSDCFINEMLMACTSIKVHHEDGLPQGMCLQCFTLLKQSFLFKKKCEDTDKYFRKYVEALQDGVVKDVNYNCNSGNTIDTVIEETTHDSICETDSVMDRNNHEQNLLRPMRIEKWHAKRGSGKRAKNVKRSKYHKKFSKKALVERNTNVNSKKKSNNGNGVSKIKQFRLTPINILENGKMITYKIQVETEDNNTQEANTLNLILNEESSSEDVDIELENNNSCQLPFDRCWEEQTQTIENENCKIFTEEITIKVEDDTGGDLILSGETSSENIHVEPKNNEYCQSTSDEFWYDLAQKKTPENNSCKMITDDQASSSEDVDIKVENNDCCQLPSEKCWEVQIKMIENESCKMIAEETTVKVEDDIGENLILSGETSSESINVKLENNEYCQSTSDEFWDDLTQKKRLENYSYKMITEEIQVKPEDDVIGEVYTQDLELSTEIYPEYVDVKLENCQAIIDQSSKDPVQINFHDSVRSPDLFNVEYNFDLFTKL